MSGRVSKRRSSTAVDVSLVSFTQTNPPLTASTKSFYSLYVHSFVCALVCCVLKLRFFFFNHVVDSLNNLCYNKYYATNCDQILDFDYRLWKRDVEILFLDWKETLRYERSCKKRELSSCS